MTCIEVSGRLFVKDFEVVMKGCDVTAAIKTKQGSVRRDCQGDLNDRAVRRQLSVEDRRCCLLIVFCEAEEECKSCDAGENVELQGYMVCREQGSRSRVQVQSINERL